MKQQSHRHKGQKCKQAALHSPQKRHLFTVRDLKVAFVVVVAAALHKSLNSETMDLGVTSGSKKADAQMGGL